MNLICRKFSLNEYLKWNIIWPKHDRRMRPASKIEITYRYIAITNLSPLPFSSILVDCCSTDNVRLLTTYKLNNESSEFRMALECSLGFLYKNIAVNWQSQNRQTNQPYADWIEKLPESKTDKTEYYEHTLLHSHSQVMINSLDHILSNYEVFLTFKWTYFHLLVADRLLVMSVQYG